MRLRSAGAVLLVLGYTALVYWACTQTEPRWWALLPLLIPLVLGLVGAVLGQRVRPRVRLALQWLAVLALVTLIYEAFHGEAGLHMKPDQVRLFYLVQELLILALVAGAFARSLLPGRKPLCSAIAESVHDVMTDALWRYTRALTWAWLIWVMGLGCVSVLLFAYASPHVWTAYSTVWSNLSMLLVFFLEVTVVRRWFLPEGERMGWLGTFRAMRHIDWRKWNAPSKT